MENNKLTRLAKILKGEALLAAGVIIVLVILGLSFFTSYKKQSNYSYQGVKWENKVIPGQTTTSELKKIIGEPAEFSNNVLNYYPKPDEQRPLSFEITDNKVEFIKEPVTKTEKGKLQDYLTQLGSAEKILYSDYYGPVIQAHVWAKMGILIFADEPTGIIFEIWYFPPTKIENLIKEHPDLKEQLDPRF